MSDLSKNASAHLLQVGFAAIKTGMYDSAQAIFEGIDRQEMDNAAGRIGLAMTALVNGDMEKAVVCLDDMAFSNKSNAYEAKKLLLIASILSGDQEKAGRVHQSLAEASKTPMSTEKQQEAKVFFTPSS